MTQKKLVEAREQAYLAYRLGCLPFILLEGECFRSLWLNGRDLLYERAMAEGQEAINRLEAVTNGKGNRLANAARNAIRTRWLAMKRRWAAALSAFRPVDESNERTANNDDLDRIPIAYLDRLESDQENLLDQQAYKHDSAWQRWFNAIERFCACLPKFCRAFAALGAAIGNLVTMHTKSAREWHRPSAWSHTVIVDLESMIAKMSQEYELLVGIEINLSVSAHRAHAYLPYFFWAKDQAHFLHRLLIRRLRPDISPLDDNPTWIPAMKAYELATDFNVPISLSHLSKLARKQPKLFESRRVGLNKLFIRLDSFVKFLWNKRAQQQESEPTKEDASEYQRIHDTKKKQRLD